MPEPLLIGLGLTPDLLPPEGVGQDLWDKVLLLSQGRTGDFRNSLTEADFTALVRFWARTEGAARLAVLPFGKFGRALAADPSGLDLAFFDANPTPPVRQSRDLDPGEHPLVLVASPAFEGELVFQLTSQGYRRPNVVTAADLGEAVLAAAWPEEAVRAMAEALRSRLREGKAPAVATDRFAGIGLARRLMRSGLGAEGLVHCDDEHYLTAGPTVDQDGLDGTHDQISAVLSAAPASSAMRLYRDLHWTRKTRADLVFPHLPAGETPLDQAEDPTPVFFYCLANTGTGRILPTLNALTGILARPRLHLREPDNTPRLLDREPGFHRPLPPELRASQFRCQLEGMDYYEWATAHFPLDLSGIAQIPCLKTVVLLRDPRDVITSLSASSLPDRATFKRRVLRYIGGTLLNDLARSVVVWPRIDALLDNFLTVRDHAHMRFFRFEDIHRDPHAAWRDLLDWLGWATPFARIGAQDLDRAIHLASFRFQSSGARSRGSEGTWTRGKTYGSIRKGIVGDWKNHWDQEMKDRFKELAGDRLVRLDYEADDAW